MRTVESPTVYLVAKTQLCEGIDEYLEDIGDPDWDSDQPGVSDGELLVEAAGRMCYRSWQAYDPEKPLATNPNVTKVRKGNKPYIGNVLDSRHGSILEHVNASFIFRDVSRVLTHELVRHRAGMAYCLDGDTLIYSEKMCNGLRNGAKKRKLSQLFEMTKTSHGRSRLKLLRLRTYNFMTKQFETGRVKTIIDSREKDTFEITTDSGKKITCSTEHRIMTDKGWQTLNTIMGSHMILSNGQVAWGGGTKVAINGVALHQSYEWMYEHYIRQNLYQHQVAKIAGVSDATIKKWVKILGLQKGVTGAYRGDIWNKGKTYKTRPKTLKERRAISKRMLGENNHRWKGGETRPANNVGNILRKEVYERDDFQCQLCGKIGGSLTIHHIIPNWYDKNFFWKKKNLTTVCRDCHYIINGNELEYIDVFSKTLRSRIDQKDWNNRRPTPPSRRLSIKMENISSIRHIGKRHTYDIEMDEPEHKRNFVANGLVVHNSQESLRYVRLNDLSFWLPTIIQQKKDAVDLFLEAIDTMEKWQEQLANIFEINSMKDFALKKKLTSAFRRIAPIGLATTILVTGNLRSWRHIIQMRTETVAEEEIRIVLGEVAEILKKEYPHIFQDMEKNDDGEWVFENRKV